MIQLILSTQIWLHLMINKQIKLVVHVSYLRERTIDIRITYII